MKLKWQAVVAIFTLCLILVPGKVSAGPVELVEVKVFSLKDRMVVAAAIEERMLARGAEDVGSYGFVPYYEESRARGQLEVILPNVGVNLPEKLATPLVTWNDLGDGRVRLTVPAPWGSKTELTVVARKTVKTRDQLIRMRSYLTISIAKGGGIVRGPTVVLDPGHGGADTGAVKNFILEKDLNLDIALRAARLFEAKGWDVVLTRRDDVAVSLLDRADMANIVGADLFISIHNNSLPDDKIPRSREFGTTVLYNSAAVRPAYDLASIMQDELVAALGTNREVLQDRPGLAVLNSTWVPAILTEGVMMTNPANAKLIQDRFQRQQAAQAIVQATERWRGRRVLATGKGRKAAQPIVEIPDPVPPGSGNSSPNTANHGILAARDGWIHYLMKAEPMVGEKEETLWRFRPDRFLSDELIADVEAWDVNATSDWVYFSNWSDGQSIYRMRSDGTERSRLIEGPAQQISLNGDKLVFVRNKQVYAAPQAGGLPVRIAEDAAENLAVWGDWVYYANGSDAFKPYKIRTDGTQRQKIVDDETLFLVVAGDWIFYSNLSDGEKLYRVRTDGTGRAQVCDDRVGYINFAGGKIYYTNTLQRHALYSIRPDGTSRVLIKEGDGVAGPVGIAGGKGYYRGIFIDLK